MRGKSLGPNFAYPKGRWQYLVVQSLHGCCASCDLIDWDQETAHCLHKELHSSCCLGGLLEGGSSLDGRDKVSPGM